MGRQRRSFILGLLFALICLSPLHAQTGNKGASDSNAPAASPTSTGQAPDEVTRKLTDLVHAGKYREAQQLTTGLLAAYPNDQRLIKAKAVIATLLSPASQAVTAPGQPVQPAADTNAGQLSGMDKVDYSCPHRAGAAGEANHRSVRTTNSAATVYGTEQPILAEAS